MKLPSLHGVVGFFAELFLFAAIGAGLAFWTHFITQTGSRFLLRAALLAALLAAGGSALAQDFNYPAYMQLPVEYREWFRNPDGSCVQCSQGIVGCHGNNPVMTFLLFDTEYGPAIHKGSWPGRVAEYAKKRGMRIYNVTGDSYEDTRPWMIWSAKTNRFCAIGAGSSHFQTLYGYIPGDPKPWKVCNNNSPQTIDEYTEQGFRRLHEASGPWVIVPDEPSSPPPPRIVPWWQ